MCLASIRACLIKILGIALADLSQRGSLAKSQATLGHVVHPFWREFASSHQSHGIGDTVSHTICF